MDPKSRSGTGAGDAVVSDYCGNTELPFELPSGRQVVGEANPCVVVVVKGLKNAY
jgi:hypothetical protein